MATVSPPVDSQRGNTNPEVGIRRLGPFPGSPVRLAFGIDTFFVMPILHTNLNEPALAAHKHLSYETILSGWLTSFGWEVLIPLVDHGRRTDLVIADDEGRYYRIQVKTVQTATESVGIKNRWHGSRLDYIVIFSTRADWGFIAPAFEQSSRRVNDPRHIRFHCDPEHFKRAFERA